MTQSQNKYSLITPVVKIQMFPDENPISYLVRLTHHNCYRSINWLIQKKTQGTPLINYQNAYKIIESIPWIDHQSISITNQDIIKLNPIYLHNSFTKFCPICLTEGAYYRLHWQVKAATICTKHAVYLQDQCSQCSEYIPLRSGITGFCICGYDLSFSATEAACISTLKMALFLEGKSHNNYSINKLLSSLTLSEKSQFILTAYKWMPYTIKSETLRSYKKYSKAITLQNSQLVSKVVANAFFNGKSGFIKYLKELDNLPIKNNPHFVRFYKDFYKSFPQEYFQQYKIWLETYIKSHWNKPLTKRNNLFSTDLLKQYPWIPFKKACQSYHIRPLILKRAIKDGTLTTVTHKQGTRNYILIYKPHLDVEKDKLETLKNFKDATNFLGVTKSQLYELIDQKHFPLAIPPQAGYSQSWQFSERSLQDYISKFIRLSKILQEEDLITLAESMKIIGNRIDTPFAELLSSIRNKVITITLNNKSDYITLKDIYLSKTKLKKWIYKMTYDITELTIPDAANILNINQEFMYQLINQQLLKYDIQNSMRIIRPKHLDLFHSQYVILAHLSRNLGIHSRTLLKMLNEAQIYSIDHLWTIKLRQKVYEKHIIDTFIKQTSCFMLEF